MHIPLHPVPLIALFINMLSIGTIMMVMPLGPDFVINLGMESDYIGFLAGSATFATAAIAFMVAPVLDQYNKKKSLVFFFSLKSVLLLICATAQSKETLTLWFLLSSSAGGPVAGIVIASVIDVTPGPQRGRVMAFVASGYSLAAIAIVPLSLWLAQWTSWRGSFLFFGTLGLAISAVTYFLFPTVNSNAATGTPLSRIKEMGRNPLIGLALLTACLQIFGQFFLIPHFSSYFQFNLSFPREQIPSLYLLGGLFSLIALQISGRLLDKGKAIPMCWLISTFAITVAWVGFVWLKANFLYISFALFMAAISVRTNIVAVSLSHVPLPHQRAAFSSIQGAISNSAAGMAGVLSALFITTNPDNSLVGFPDLVLIFTVAGLILPLLLQRVLHGLGPQNDPPKTQAASLAQTK